VLDREGQVIAAVSISGPTDRLRRPRRSTISAVTQAARHLE